MTRGHQFHGYGPKYPLRDPLAKDRPAWAQECRSCYHYRPCGCHLGMDDWPSRGECTEYSREPGSDDDRQG